MLRAFCRLPVRESSFCCAALRSVCSFLPASVSVALIAYLHFTHIYLPPSHLHFPRPLHPSCSYLFFHYTLSTHILVTRTLRPRVSSRVLSSSPYYTHLSIPYRQDLLTLDSLRRLNFLARVYLDRPPVVFFSFPQLTSPITCQRSPFLPYISRASSLAILPGI